MFRYFFKGLLSHLRNALSLHLLTLFGVALGVTSVLAIQIVNRNAVAAFEGGVEAVSGPGDLQIQGYSGEIPETLFPQVLGVPGVEAAWPIFQVSVLLEDGTRLEIIGLDLTRPDLNSVEEANRKVQDFLSTKGWVAVDQGWAGERSLGPGDRISCSFGSRRVDLVIGTLWDIASLGAPTSRMAFTDIAQAQGLFGGRGKLTRIDVKLLPGTAVAEVLPKLESFIGDTAQVVTAEQERQTAGNLLSGFRLNLTALSLISLFVGLFLIYTSTQASLVRRRTEFGLLRSLGATRGQVLSLILGETFLLGATGVALGIPMGYWTAEQSLSAVNSTLTNIYLLREIEHLRLPVWLLWLAAGIGIGSSLLGALLPALDMSRKNTRELLSAHSLRSQMKQSAVPLLWIGLGLIAVGTAACTIAGLDWKPAGFVLGIALLVGLPLTAPFAILRICGSFRIRSFGLSYSLKSLADRVQNTSFAVASLGIAVSMLIGITLMVGSFRETVRVWVESTIVADLYVTSRSWQGAGSSASLELELVNYVESLPGVESVDQIRTEAVEQPGERLLVSGADLNSPRSLARYPILEGDPMAAYRDLAAGTGVLISEPLARRKGLRAGQEFHLPGSDRNTPLRVSGVIYDYTSEWGLIVTNLAQMERLFGPGEANSIAVYLQPGTGTDDFLDTHRESLSKWPLRLISSSQLRAAVLHIFDQTFAVVRILQLTSLLIAAAGVTLTLLILARERLSELALYRALGAQRTQIFQVFVGKGLATAGLAILLGLVGGLLLAAILIFVINRTYFGWTIQVHFNWPALAAEVALILLAAVIASLYPALRASQIPATELSREDL